MAGVLLKLENIPYFATPSDKTTPGYISVNMLHIVTKTEIIICTSHRVSHIRDLFLSEWVGTQFVPDSSQTATHLFICTCLPQLQAETPIFHTILNNNVKTYSTAFHSIS